MWSLLDFFSQPFMIGVLDIGAALGERPVYQPLLDAGRARLVGFEPDAAECDKLNRTYGPPHRFLPHFVADGRPRTFHQTNWALTGSLFEPNTPLLSQFQNLAELVTPVATHEVPTTRLDDVEGLGDVDLLKIDVQGGELAVFENGPRTLADVLVIQTEVEFLELYKGQPMFADVDRCLRGQGFQFHTFQGFGGRAFKPLMINNEPNRALRQYLWSDAVYVRDWMHLDALSVEKLIKYAVLCHDVLGSYDLSHFVLGALDARTGGTLQQAYLARLTAGGS